MSDVDKLICAWTRIGFAVAAGDGVSDEEYEALRIFVHGRSNLSDEAIKLEYAAATKGGDLLSSDELALIHQQSAEERAALLVEIKRVASVDGFSSEEEAVFNQVSALVNP